jgi:DNA transformation protein
MRRAAYPFRTHSVSPHLVWAGILSNMAVSDEFLQYVLEQLAGLEHVAHRRMFGGIGLYLNERIFGLIFADILYFKVNDSNRGDYETRGMSRFRPYADKPLLSMTYYEVPADVLEDADECAAWARKSTAVSAAPTSRPRKNLRRR